MRIVPALLLGQFLFTTAALAQDVPTKKLVITPARIPSPALKHRLMPHLHEMRPGNAALLYQRAHSPEWFAFTYRPEPHFKSMYERIHEAGDTPLSKLTKEKINFLPTHMLKEIDLGARRIHCDWEMIDRIREEGFGMLIPDVQSFRTYGTLLSLRTRLHLLDRNYDSAIHSLQTHITLARHVSEAPILINVLVANAILSLALRDLEEMTELEGSPSLFWAMTDLPRPLVHYDRAVEGERLITEVVWPGIREALKDPGRAPLTVEQLQVGLKNLIYVDGGTLGNKLGIAFLASRSYPKAREVLLARGFSEAQLDAMPVLQVSMMYAVIEYDRLYDAQAKWRRQPFWIARPGMEKDFEAFLEARDHHPDVSRLPAMIIPALETVRESQARVERKLALLQTIEALRLYAGLNKGKLPASLADIKDLPLPVDPMTGKSFEYQLADGKATLFAPVPPGMAATPTNMQRYEITVAEKASGE